MYEAKTFEIPDLKGISTKNIEEHLKLYSGYVTHVNKISELMMKPESVDEYALKEARRRLAFEFDGMRNHEYYFGALEGGQEELPADATLRTAIDNQFGDFDTWLSNFKKYLATTRGVGWAILGYDQHAQKLLNYWVDEQHLGHLTGVQPIVTLDMWEHAYVADYQPSGKGKYIEDYFENVNWETINKWFEQTVK